MLLFEGKTRQASVNGAHHKKTALAVGAVLLMTSSIASASTIGFEGWYAPEFWVASDESKVDFNEEETELTLDGSGGVLFSILMPEQTDFLDPNPVLELRGDVVGTFDGNVRLSMDGDWINFDSFSTVERQTPFLAGELFTIRIESGSMTLSNFQAPAAERPATVPEPATLGLMGLGLAALGWRKRK